MFGYIGPDRPYLFIKDETLYKALYCGVCRAISAECGQMARTALTYDMAFMSALVHNIRGEDVKIVRRRCPVHPIRRRPMTETDDVTRLLACVNTVLAYYKLTDDKADGDKRGALRFLYNKGYKRALKKYPNVVDIVSGQMRAQAELEKQGCTSIDMACEPTAQMMRQLSAEVLGEHSNEHTEGLSYAIGKWVYLIDALDDYDKDVKKGNYNPFYEAFGEKTRAEMLAKNGEEADFVFKSVFAANAENLKNIRFYFNHDLTDNIILRGLPAATQRVKCGCKDKIRPEKARLR